MQCERVWLCDWVLFFCLLSYAVEQRLPLETLRGSWGCVFRDHEVETLIILLNLLFWGLSHCLIKVDLLEEHKADMSSICTCHPLEIKKVLCYSYILGSLFMHCFMVNMWLLIVLFLSLSVFSPPPLTPSSIVLLFSLSTTSSYLPSLQTSVSADCVFPHFSFFLSPLLFSLLIPPPPL